MRNLPAAILDLLPKCKGNLVRVLEELPAGGAMLSYSALGGAPIGDPLAGDFSYAVLCTAPRIVVIGSFCYCFVTFTAAPLDTPPRKPAPPEYLAVMT
jgi:hypothetical protein